MKSAVKSLRRRRLCLPEHLRERKGVCQEHLRKCAQTFGVFVRKFFGFVDCLIRIKSDVVRPLLHGWRRNVWRKVVDPSFKIIAPRGIRIDDLGGYLDGSTKHHRGSVRTTLPAEIIQPRQERCSYLIWNIGGAFQGLWRRIDFFDAAGTRRLASAPNHNSMGRVVYNSNYSLAAPFALHKHLGFTGPRHCRRAIPVSKSYFLCPAMWAFKSELRHVR
jgi:hypothetical protein